ncbi:Bug family tripartite tricarboxylate transporter substrate binding protein [Sporomusa termitida]|uniref:Tripartite tricarboxylate transporter family receptor n=1 Tax=Sporomusa termitida TaxID=2377 RepID=A0A517DNF4_9FIRM|nr:tripartite tricarboxylate transporter substrate binding protein [Sporomusa termitida]QDR78891.1 Tripartite tricarboxylate transporter family receptor [Sporomusa termitida]
MKKWLAVVLACLMLAGLVAGCGSQEKAADKPAAFTPSKNTEFIVPYAPGGGSDLFARILADIIQKNKFADEALMIVNKPGGAGAVGDAYTFSKKGDNHVITAYVSGQMTSNLMNKTAVSYDKLTPIVNLALDEYLLGVLAGNYKAFDELLAAAKAAPNEITIGGSGKGTEDELCVGLLNRHTGARFKYVPFNSSGEVMSAMLGGHIKAGIFNPNECNAQIAAGKVATIGGFGVKRLASVFKDTPTFGELGYQEVVFQQFRGIAGPPDMSPAAVKFWVEAFRKATQTAQWQQDYLAKNSLTEHFLEPEAFKKFLGEENQKYADILNDIAAQ